MRNKHLSRRVKKIEEVFEQRYNDLKKAIDKERKNGTFETN